MSTTPPDAPAGPEQGPRVTGEQVRDLARLRRTTRDRHVAGVAGGLARHLDIDPVIVRVAFVVLIFFGGAGLLLYGACWLLVPADDGTPPVVNLDDRTRSIVLMVAGGLAALALVGDSWGVIGFPWPLAILGAVVLVLLTRARGRDAQPPPGTPPAQPGAPGTPGTPWGGWYAGWNGGGTGAPAAGTPDPGDPGSAGAPGDPATAWQPAEEPAWQAGQAGQAGQVPYAAAYSAPYAGAPYAGPSYAGALREPTSRGPRLFWTTMALAALGIGAMGIADLSGAPIPDSAYPALVVGVCGVMLVVGAFVGRAGGLIAVGLVAALAMAGTAVAENIAGTNERVRPLTSVEVESRYDMGAGDLVLDLRDVADPEDLAGRVITVDGGVGGLEVIVPDGLRVEATVDVGVGSAEVFGRTDNGLGVSSTASTGPSTATSEALEIEADLGVGRVRIQTEEDAR